MDIELICDNREIKEMKHDIERHLNIISSQVNEIDALKAYIEEFMQTAFSELGQELPGCGTVWPQWYMDLNAKSPEQSLEERDRGIYNKAIDDALALCMKKAVEYGKCSEIDGDYYFAKSSSASSCYNEIQQLYKGE